MTRRTPTWLALCLACALAGCDTAAPPPAATSDAALTDPEHPGEEPGEASTGAEAMPPATPPADDAAPAVAIDHAGVAGIAFGAAPGGLRDAFPQGVSTDAAVAPGSCHFMYVQPKPIDGYGVALMVEGDRFVRVDVDAPDVVAPGGGHAGMTADAVRALYGAGIEEQPHKYVEGGKYLVVAPADGGAARLVFEVDAAGVVTAWRLGLPPQVHYVEGCA
jgi:hypothetical protein